MMEFAAYLNHKRGRTAAKDGPSLTDQRLIGHSASRFDPDNFVIILPDDDASLTEMTAYRDGGRELLFLHEPRPRIPQLLDPFVSRLHVVSYAFAHQQLPDRWLRASATMRK